MRKPRNPSERSPVRILAERNRSEFSFGKIWLESMPVDCLIDTGAILALLDRNDRWHTVCAEAFRHLRLPLATSEAVLTELFHLAGNGRWEMDVAWSFVKSGAIVLHTIADAELPEIHTLMSRYWDRPTDFADATLVYLARRESITTILTVDHSDFETYRIVGRRKFRIVPSRRP
jgi:predicted nucleic acid-binding protein